MNRNLSHPWFRGDQLFGLVSGSLGPAPCIRLDQKTTFKIPARSALQNWPSGTSLQHLLFSLMEAYEEDERFEEGKLLPLEALMLLTTLQSGQTWFSWIQKIGPPLFVHIRVCASQRVLGLFLIFGFDPIFTHFGMFPKASPTLSQVEPGSGVKNHLQRAMKCEQDICQNNLGRPVRVL